MPILRLTENLDGNPLIGYQVRSTDHSGVSLIPRTTQRLVLQPILFHRRAISLFLQKGLVTNLPTLIVNEIDYELAYRPIENAEREQNLGLLGIFFMLVLISIKIYMTY